VDPAVYVLVPVLAPDPMVLAQDPMVGA